jgi:PAS domain S-box-containing protein
MPSSPRELPHDPPEEKPRISLLSQNKPTDIVDWTSDLVEHSRDLLCVHDLEGRFLSVNPVPARLLGYTVEEILEIPMRELVDPQFRDQFDSYLRVIASAGETTGILAVMTRTGERRYWEYHCTLRTEGVGKPVVRGIAHDVTERIEAERSLQKTNKILEQHKDKQEVLLRELQLFRTLVDNSNDAIEVVDPETMRLLDVNEKCCAKLGYTRDELLSMTIYDIDPQLTPERLAETREQLRKTGCRILESTHRRKDGTTFPIEVNIRRVQLDREYLVAISRDITERKLRDGRLQEYERVVESLDEMIVVVNRDHRYVLANRAFLRHRGMTKDQVIGRPISEVLIPDAYHNTIRQKLEESFAGKVVHYEMKYAYPQRGERDLAITYLPVEGPEGIDRVAVVLQDITDRNRAEEALRQSEERMRLAHEAAQIGVFERNMTTGESRWTPQMEAMYGLTPGMAPSSVEDLLRLIHPADRENMKRLLDESIATGSSGGEWRVVWPDGSVHWIAGRWRVFKDELGKPLRALGVDVDITKRKQMEEALRASEADLQEAQRVALMGSWRFDLLTQNVTGPDQMYRIMGMEPRPQGVPFHELQSFFLPESWRHIVETNRKAVETGQPDEIEVAGRRPDGSITWLLVRGKTDTDEAGRVIGVSGIAIDITERKRAEQALRESEERLRLAQEVARIGTFDRNLLTGETRGTPQLQAMYGLGSDELPQSLEGFLNLIHPDDRPQVSSLIAQSFESCEGSGEWRTRWRDGTVRWISGKWRVFKDANGTPVRLVGSDHDITDRKQIEQELRAAKEKLTEEKLYLEQEIDAEFGFEEIIGQSKALKTAMESVAKVAASDAAVLLLGETGTGKELVARAIHRLSRRKGNAFIKMNCAAIPSGLLESELFGNEKGAFTGAVSRKIGRLELADKGTIFLDEIGEISLSLQPKLLRVLQDQEFERLGGTQTLKVNFRLIAATNRDLAQSVRDKEFRSDLFYRLSVFPIFLPPLRERREDIPLLVEHFVRKISRRMKKSITSIPRKTMNALTAWSWPGNVRELENFIERSLILTTGSMLNAPLSELQPAAGNSAHEQTLEAAERRHILDALRESRGQISGPRGAATRLGLKRTTLQSKLKQLGINPRVPPQAP